MINNISVWELSYVNSKSLRYDERKPSTLIRQRFTVLRSYFKERFPNIFV